MKICQRCLFKFKILYSVFVISGRKKKAAPPPPTRNLKTTSSAINLSNASPLVEASQQNEPQSQNKGKLCFDLHSYYYPTTETLRKIKDRVGERIRKEITELSNEIRTEIKNIDWNPVKAKLLEFSPMNFRDNYELSKKKFIEPLGDGEPEDPSLVKFKKVSVKYKNRGDSQENCVGRINDNRGHNITTDTNDNINIVPSNIHCVLSSTQGECSKVNGVQSNIHCEPSSTHYEYNNVHGVHVNNPDVFNSTHGVHNLTLSNKSNIHDLLNIKNGDNRSFNDDSSDIYYDVEESFTFATEQKHQNHEDAQFEHYSVTSPPPAVNIKNYISFYENMEKAHNLDQNSKDRKIVFVNTNIEKSYKNEKKYNKGILKVAKDGQKTIECCNFQSRQNFENNNYDLVYSDFQSGTDDFITAHKSLTDKKHTFQEDKKNLLEQVNLSSENEDVSRKNKNISQEKSSPKFSFYKGPEPKIDEQENNDSNEWEGFLSKLSQILNSKSGEFV